jgi:maleate cis-trans isomerase
MNNQPLGRRTVLFGAAGLALTVPRTAEAASYLVGCVKPLGAPPAGQIDSTVTNLKRVLPPGIELILDYVGIKEGSASDLLASLKKYKTSVAGMAARHCDTISIEGAPPFMVLGRQKETELINDWLKTYKIPMFTSSQNQASAFTAVGAKNILGITELDGPINQTFANYFISAGHNIVAMDAMPGHNFSNLFDVTSQQVYDFIKQRYSLYKNIDTIYMLGPTWGPQSALDIIEPIERELNVTLIHPLPAESWGIQQCLNIYRPITGYGKLLATLPA